MQVDVKKKDNYLAVSRKIDVRELKVDADNLKDWYIDTTLTGYRNRFIQQFSEYKRENIFTLILQPCFAVSHSTPSSNVDTIYRSVPWYYVIKHCDKCNGESTPVFHYVNIKDSSNPKTICPMDPDCEDDIWYVYDVHDTMTINFLVNDVTCSYRNNSGNILITFDDK